MEEGKEDRKINKYSCACSIVASMISIIFGYETGVTSGAMIFIKEDLKINDVQVQVFAGIINFCALVGALSAGRTSDYIGRRYTISLASTIFLLGSLLMGFAPSYAVLLIGRCVAGIGVGFALVIAPVYSAEISATNTRGILSSLPEIGISLGILLGYISNYFFSKLALNIGWRIMFFMATIPSIGLAFGILRMPESPRWLAIQGRLRDAKHVLLKVSNSKEEAQSRLQDIKLAIGIDADCNDDFVTLKQNTCGKGVWKELLLRPTPPVRWVLLAAIGIHFFEHATGIEAVVLYGPRIFKKAGVTTNDKLLLANIGVGVAKTIFITASTFFIDKAGRRKLLLTSVGGMIIALLGLGFALTIVHQSHDQKVVWALWLSIATCYIYVMFFSIGLAPITWVYSSEIFPLKLRAQGASIGVAVNRVTNATVSMTFLSLVNAITIGGAFFMFAGMAVLAWIFFFFFLPETKGRSLEEMEQVFTRVKKSRNVDVELQTGNKGVQVA
ncbi:putative major facilitator, sugar transporter, major facilitator superfamily [Helianthus annuus]|uniref:Major facilitator, sugar transporter, major facilitator superfamily n=1 Tax=Helianthus annuus TaxID=4232 RepID=A0A251S393_HELAN|nr:probable polyol transporter 6 [Helianthus annuus]KAF5762305.1 putative major facilitator, sugar transporter, major facilitator superfamily [Helianthus annuus]KAJ0445319.1 putative major facilitator, sugar transporter, major facilitator superfamily [Helianthus annuus]KAJ0646694.1 putative major facilitator, sugar transporter, major facilitator superfamily [Helianthus annuus]